MNGRSPLEQARTYNWLRVAYVACARAGTLGDRRGNGARASQ